MKCSDERRHRILIRETEDAYELTAIVAHPALLRGIENVSLRAWQRNRSMQLLGFRLDNRGRLVGETWAPKAGLTRGEFLLLIRRLAAECDHFEYHLTGKDEE
ncbi:hypothetical protein JW926_17115 [Candidatus Sumerlaeota bacterium]|nr:hypothetical protein [Candidatus Sumerlaeota bacterium]